MRDLVRRGYDTISADYRGEDGASNSAASETTSTYAGWLEELAALRSPGARVLDLGCGAGVPAAQALAGRGFDVTGVDISEVHVDRARRLVPQARFVCADMATWEAPPQSLV
jgi:2-polyprenyl-3-methyl-5-hydroxy-6-metoxy-1,4-benzoquinol methylase